MNRILIIIAVMALAITQFHTLADDAYEIGSFERIGEEHVYKIPSYYGESTYYIPAGLSKYLVLSESELPKFIIMLLEMKDYISTHDSKDSNSIEVELDIPKIGNSVEVHNISELGKKRVFMLNPDDSKIKYCGIDNIRNEEKIEFEFRSVRDPNNSDNYTNYIHGYLSFYKPEQLQQLIDILKAEMDSDKTNTGLNANTVKRYGKWRDYNNFVLGYTSSKGKTRYYIQTAANCMYSDMDESGPKYKTMDEYIWFTEDKLSGIISMFKDLYKQFKKLSEKHTFKGTESNEFYQSDTDYIPLKTKITPFNGEIVGRFSNELHIMRGLSYNGNIDVYYQHHKNGGKWLRLEIFGENKTKYLTIELPDLENLISILESIK